MMNYNVKVTTNGEAKEVRMNEDELKELFKKFFEVMDEDCDDNGYTLDEAIEYHEFSDEEHNNDIVATPDIREAVIEWLNDNHDSLQGIVYEINSYDGSMDDYDYIDMSEFDSIMEGKTPTDIANMINYGDGFSTTDEYFHFNAYGNLHSVSSYDIEHELVEAIDDIADRVIDLSGSIDVPDELQEILDLDD
jgi:hypothetical protein